MLSCRKGVISRLSATRSRLSFRCSISNYLGDDLPPCSGHAHIVACAVGPPRSNCHSFANSFRCNSAIKDAGCMARYFSAYASVDHAAAYKLAMESRHGHQLELALEEGKGKDDLPYDPFSLFVEEMAKQGQDMEGISEEESMEGTEEEDMEEISEEDMEEINEEGQEEDAQDEPIYTNSGSLRRPLSELAALRAGYPSGKTFAVILLAGIQHKVSVDDLLVVNKLKPVAHWSVGSTHTLSDNDVLLMGTPQKTLIGLPGVQGGQVDVMVEEITRDKTIVVFKKRRRKNSRRKNGFRRQVTFLRVLDIRMPERDALEGGMKDEVVAA